jgi:pyruvate dehydrogenase E1 component beta subunit
VAAPFSPVPFSPVLEQAYLPDADRIAAAVRSTLQRA